MLVLSLASWKKHVMRFVEVFCFFAIFTIIVWGGASPTITTYGGLLRSGLIVVDAGHGYPDGGAVSRDGVEEASLNLQIALKLEEALLDEGFDVIMTRSDDNNIASPDKQSSIREMKVSDIQNRIDIVNASGADCLISIHMNNFSASQYHGWQTFYQKRIGRK